MLQPRFPTAALASLGPAVAALLTGHVAIAALLLTCRRVQDITSQLRMNQPGGQQRRGFRQWVMSFERPRLHLSVQMRAAGGAATNLSHLVAEAAAGGPMQPTLIYAQTTNEVDSVTAYLQAKGVKAVK